MRAIKSESISHEPHWDIFCAQSHGGSSVHPPQHRASMDGGLRGGTGHGHLGGPNPERSRSLQPDDVTYLL